MHKKDYQFACRRYVLYVNPVVAQFTSANQKILVEKFDLFKSYNDRLVNYSYKL